ncbi:MAG TPA: NAD(P)/FAD-dependent oxidoreductase [Phycisphaerales bacterium]
MFDVIVIGGGPAGLSGALVLARCTRKVALIDQGQHRNQASSHTHGYLTQDGVTPREFIARCRNDLSKYDVEYVSDRVEDAVHRDDSLFEVILTSGRRMRSRKLLLATGVRDLLPTIDGFAQFYGRSIHHCPYCDGFEHRGQRLCAFGSGNAAVGLALALRTWSAQVVACTDGRLPDREHLGLAAANMVLVLPQRVARLEGSDGRLARLRFADGSAHDCDAMFFNTGQVQRSDLPKRLRCRFDSDGGVHTSDRQCTSVPGLYVAGDADKEVQFLIVAAAQGATAAVGINRALQDEELGTPGR